MQWPELREIQIADLRRQSIPTQRIKTEEDVLLWKSTRGYQDFGLFLRRLNESVVNHYLPWTGPSLSTEAQSMIDLIDRLDKFIDEIPPLPTPQRFGNLAFRTWGRRLEEEAPSILTQFLPAELHPSIPFIQPYLMTSFGSFTRMDYGTGHETSFLIFLLCLTLLRFFKPEPDHERELVLCVFTRYLRLCWRLQDVYKLEPAGSHGVWGLDDSSFLGYIFGSGQLRDQENIPVSAVLHPPLPPTNLYFMSIMRIHAVKHGPFHEHSSQLYSIATGVVSWAKVNSGLFKMYEAEVLGKRVVVQHLPLGGLISWDIDSQPQHSSSSDLTGVTTPTPTPTHSPWGSSSTLSSEARLPPTNFSPPRNLAAIRPGRMLSARAPLGPTASTASRTIHAGGHVPDSIHSTHLSESQQQRAPAAEGRE